MGAVSTKMRVLHLVKTSKGAFWAFRLMRELVALGFDVHVALPEDGPLVNLYKKAGINVHFANIEFPIKRPWLWSDIQQNFIALVDSVKPDIIHSHFVSNTLTMRLALGKNHHIPRIFQVPGPLHLEHKIFQQAEISVAGANDYWIGSCNWTCNKYKEIGISDSNVFLSYYGTDIDTFSPKEKGVLRKEFNIPNSKKIVGMVSWMYAPKLYLGHTRGIKGHEDLIDALSICAEIRKDIIGVFAGGPWNNAFNYEKKVRSYAHQKLGNKAIFLGTRNDIPEVYADMNLVVHPSLSENVGGAAESLLLGVPTIATNVGGFPDVIIPEKTGWLVPPRSPERLAEKILEVLRDEENAALLARNGMDYAREILDVKNSSKTIDAIYNSICMSRKFDI